MKINKQRLSHWVVIGTQLWELATRTVHWELYFHWGPFYWHRQSLTSFRSGCSS